jgi:predicted phosphodiesterase
MTTPISPKEQTELYQTITEKILFIGDSGDDKEQERKIFRKAKQHYVILLGDFVVTSHLDRKKAEKETQKGLAVV